MNQEVQNKVSACPQREENGKEKGDKNLKQGGIITLKLKI